MEELQILIFTAAFLGFIHTLLGPDHYLPFIVLSKARKWNISKTLWITFISGIGHVGGSVILGIIGIALGISLTKLEAIESYRGNVVVWMIIGFGLLYTMYGVRKYINHGGHFHLPKFLVPKKIRNLHHLSMHSNEPVHQHSHEHNYEHNHEHNSGYNHDNIHAHKHQHLPEDVTRITPWILFLIFVFGPCEVLIPLLVFPAAKHNTLGIIAVSVVFGIATLSTMLFTVYMGTKGLSVIKIKNGDRYFHLIAGLVILLSGVGMQFLGW